MAVRSNPPPVTVQIAVVLADGQNAFFVELAHALVGALRAGGTAATVVVGEMPSSANGLVPLVLPPHEVAHLGGAQALADPELRARSIAVCAEQPGSTWFAANVELLHDFGAVFDLSGYSVAALTRLGIPARRLQLGHVPAWDTCAAGDPHADRDIDVIFLGSASPRRASILAACADALAEHEAQLVISDNSRPNRDTGPGFLAGADKRARLRRARVLLSVHGGDRPYFEWLRAIDALHSGAVLVSEWSADTDPLRAGTHLLASRPTALHEVVVAALADDLRLRRMRDAGLRWLRARPLTALVTPLAEAASTIASRPWRRGAIAFAAPPRLGPEPAPEPGDGRARATKRAMLESLALRRRVEVFERRLAGRSDALEIVSFTPAWSGAPRKVAVLIPSYRHADELPDALDSVWSTARSVGAPVSVEVVVVDDGSPDGDDDVAAAWADRHPWLPVLVARHPVNRGLGPARNAAAGLTDAPRLLALDADNTLLPNGLARLNAALDAEPDAPAAYGVLICWSPNTGPIGLLSARPWQPDALVRSNYIDAFAMVRRSALDAVGGYTDDLRLHGWEDYDLWLSFVDRDLSPAFVPHAIGRYREYSSVTRTITDVSLGDARLALRQRHPCVGALDSDAAAGVQTAADQAAAVEAEVVQAAVAQAVR
jgi:GT2 family glycosyltransferase